MSESAAVIVAAEAPAAKSSRLLYAAIALALVVLVAAVAIVGYPLVIVLGIGGTAAYLIGLVALTAGDLLTKSR